MPVPGGELPAPKIEEGNIPMPDSVPAPSLDESEIAANALTSGDTSLQDFAVDEPEAGASPTDLDPTTIGAKVPGLENFRDSLAAKEAGAATAETPDVTNTLPGERDVATTKPETPTSEAESTSPATEPLADTTDRGEQPPGGEPPTAEGANPAGDGDGPIPPENMSAAEIAQEQNALSEKANRTPEEDARLQALESAWDLQHQQGLLDGINSETFDKIQFGKLSSEDQQFLKEKLPPEQFAELIKTGPEMDKAIRESGQVIPPEAPATNDGTQTEDAENVPAQPEAAEDTTTPETTEEKPATEDESQKRLSALNEKIRNGEKLTPDERAERAKLRNESKDRADLKALEAKDKKDLTDDELDRLDELRDKFSEAETPLTPEQEEAKLNQEIEDKGTELMLKLMNGEEVTDEEIAQFQELASKQALMEKGFTAEQARESVKRGMKALTNPERKSRRSREVQDKIQELMSLEYQMLTAKTQAEQLNQKREDAIDAANDAHKDAEKASDNERRRLKAIEYQKYMVVENYNASLEGLKYMAQRVNAKRQDLEQQVRRQTGTIGGLRAVVEWGSAKFNNAMTEIAILAEEELPFGAGAVAGNIQRSNLAAKGRI